MTKYITIPTPGADTVTYVIVPLEPHISDYAPLAKAGNTNLVIIYDMDWDDDLTPWPAPGVPKGCAPFKGLAELFYHHLTSVIVPEAEKTPGITATGGRRLVGISLSGLFTLWQWIEHDFFDSIACISGSFWYENFTSWLQSTTIPDKKGLAWMCLGVQEPKSKVKIFSTVGTCTAEVVDCLRAHGIRTEFEWVPGDHYAPFIPRFTQALQALATADRREAGQ